MNNKHKGSAMLSGKNVFALGLILGLSTPNFTFAKNGVKEPSSATDTKDAEKAAKEAAKVAEKATKDADKLAKKAAQEEEKAAKELLKSQSRIELLAKMKQEEAVDTDDEVEVDVSENEASLKYRVKNGSHRLTAEIEGFKDGDIFSMYIVIGNKEVLVSKMELVGDETSAAQEVEFDDATWPTGVPLEITSGTLVKVRDSKGLIVLEGALESKK
jgi:mRNA-degrading endonuclease RelE of RelBE toxin-antitoxin system